MTGRPATYAKEEIIQAIEKLREDPTREVNVNQIRAMLNGGNRDRIRRVLDEYQKEAADKDEHAEANANMAGFAKLEQELRENVGETLVANMNSILSLIAKTAESEQAKARRELNAAKEAYELLLRDRDAELERNKECHAELCTLLDDLDGQLDAAYASAAQLTAERDATALERDRLAAEAGRLGAENARLAAELSKRKSRSGGAGAHRNISAEETGSAVKTVSQVPVHALETGDCPGGQTAAGPAAATVLQNNLFSLATCEDVDGATRADGPTSVDNADNAEPEPSRAQRQETAGKDAMQSKPTRGGAPMLKSVGAPTPVPVVGRAEGGAVG